MKENQLKLTAFANRIREAGNSTLQVTGLTSELFGLLFNEGVGSTEVDRAQLEPNLFLFNTEEEASDFYYRFKDKIPCLEYFPNLERDIYSSIIQNDYDFEKRLSIVSKISQKHGSINIVATYCGAKVFLPSEEFFNSTGFKIKVDEIYELDEISQKLVSLGYRRAFSVDEPGTFAIKGEIFDLHPINGQPVRINFFDTIVETINRVDPDTLMSIKNSELNHVEISKSGQSIISEENNLYFKNKFPRPNLSQKDMFEQRKRIFESLTEGNTFENFQLYTSYFFEKPTTLLHWCSEFKTFFFNRSDIIKDFELYIEDLASQREEYLNYNEAFIPAPDEIFSTSIDQRNYINISEFNNEFEKENISEIPLNIKLLAADSIHGGDLKDKIKNVVLKITDYTSRGYIIFLISENDSKKKEIHDYFKFFTDEKIQYLVTLPYSISQSYIYESEKIIFLSDNEFFTNRKTSRAHKKKTIKQDYDLFAEQLSTLNKDDYVIHKLHGVGKYLGVETLTLGGSTSDYLVIEYKDSDKVYVPVYKLDLVQKYATADTKATIADLKKNKFEQAKAKARDAVKKLAFSLIELQARRELKRGYAFNPPDQDFNDFSLSFPFSETPDQEKAIDSVIDDMTSEKPMDRLVCGDVGFGKTEVAMRAAYKAVLDGKQVAMLVPTTILAYQHYNSFKQRFKNFAVEIESVSRLRSPKETKTIQEKLIEGKVDILIGTHKILSDKFKYKDLGLLVIDEEQRFGVGHKEKLKLIKENVDTLTMTATPIPRTLQLSFLGLKQLSLIKTPPPRRQSIRTYVIKEDQNTLRTAIQKELARNGQVYIVHNKVSDIEIFTGKIRELAPKARIVYAHGQLPERELEKRIAAFYKHDFDILVSTTIIESGIDIPNANTMIIDRADTFGLSQLHQLRGRIGRSNRKAYAYFVIPKFKKLSEVSRKRLKALQNFADLGSGFSISSSDLEIRGAGDILGPEQSGHINNIGLELYMELLNDAIQDIKGTPSKLIKYVDVQTNFEAYIPESYISNSSIRLKFYKLLASSTESEDLERHVESLIDQYGKLPEELLNLVLVMKSKIILIDLGVEAVKVQSKTVTLKFSHVLVDADTQLRDKIISFFTQRPKIYKINPDYSINCLFKDKITVNDYYEFVKYLKSQFE